MHYINSWFLCANSGLGGEGELENGQLDITIGEWRCFRSLLWLVTAIARKNKSEAVETCTTKPETTKTVVESSPMPRSSPGVTTRRMSSLSPTSPGVTTRKMAAISPGGINRRLIIE
ncbi:hypothetical protein PVAP13_9KG028720 [Panicum virgatum]|uniref:Uncharacterized protein n=1 Tax=Panicum virgatum TaxID=38727 RepID=A0A8T0N3F5_PANVG|nr:hypothetical protein PVAP13_9KG028720 [Panicum virgatum]